MRAHLMIFPLLLWIASFGAQPSVIPKLEIESPPDLSVVRQKLAALGAADFASIVKLTGVDQPGPPVRVILSAENSDLARTVAPWIAGFAEGEAGVVVLFPARSPGYPDNSLEDVLRHEVAHVLISRAAGGRSVPRWFNEGLALSAERSWGMEDQTRALYELIVGPASNFAEIDRMFRGNQTSQSRAYALSGTVVRDLFQQYGDDASARILRAMRGGLTFEDAFREAIGTPLDNAEEAFWRRQRTWTTWVPVLTSSATVWLIVTLIAMWAIRRRRMKDAEIRRRWDEDEDDVME